MITSDKENKDGQENKLFELIILSGKKSDGDTNRTFQKDYYSLLELESSPLSLTELIYSIMTENSNENKFFKLKDNEQKHFLVYLKNWLNKIYYKKEAKNISDLEDKILKMILIFFNEKVFEGNKSLFEEIFQSLFNLMHVNNQMTVEKIKSFTGKIFSDLKDELLINKEISLSKLRNLLILTESLAFFQANNIKHTSELIEYYGVIHLIFEKYVLINEGNFNEIERKKFIKEKVFLLNQIVGTYCKISVKLFEIFKKDGIIKYLAKSMNKIQESSKENNDNNDLFFNSEIFLILADKILKINSDFQLKLEQAISINLFYVNTEDMTDIKYGVNSAKSNILELLTILSDYLTQSNIFDNFDNFKNYAKNICVDLIKGLGEFYKQHTEFIEKTDNNDGERMILKHIVRILEYLTISAQNSAGVAVFTENKIQILRYIIIPNLKITPYEQDLFKFEPTEFAHNLIDLTSKQESKMPKHKAIKLIDIMCEFIDSFLKFVTEFYLDLLLFVISKNNPNSDQNSYTVLKENYCSIFYDYIETFSDENILDQVLIVLSSISYLIYEKEKLRMFFEDKIENVNYILINIQNEMIKAKLCNFYSFTLDDMFHDSKNILTKAFDDSFHFLFSCLISENSNVTLNLVAIESLSTLIFDDNMKVLVTDIVKLYIRNMLNLINITKFRELTENLLYHNFVKYLLTKFFNEIENDLIYVFAYFWNEVKLELELVIKGEISHVDGVLKDKKFKLLEQIHNLKSLVNTCITKSQNVETKQKIFEELLTILNFGDKFINYEYEEDILEIISLILNNLKLVPDLYKDKLNLMLDKLISNKNYKFERYHVIFIFTFMKNLRREDNLIYKNKIFTLISNRLLFVEKSTSVMKIFNDHSNITDLLLTWIIFYWNDIVLNDNFENSDYYSILTLITKRLGMNPISDDVLPRKLCLCFYLLVIKLDNISQLKELKKFKNLEILLVKSFTLTTDVESLEENSVSAIFASTIIIFLFKEFYSSIQNFKQEFADNSIINYIKHFINFNIDQLLYLRKASTDFKDKNVFKEQLKEEIKNKKGKIFKKIVNEEDRGDMEINSDSDYENNKIKIRKDFSGKKKDELNYSLGEDDSDTESDEEEEHDDLINGILNENSDDDDKDDEFLKVRSYKKELHTFLKLFSPDNLTSFLNTVNEFKLFDGVLNFIHNENQDIYAHLLASFTNTKLNIMNNIRKFIKILPSSSNSESHIKFRKIVKIKRK